MFQNQYTDSKNIDYYLHSRSFRRCFSTLLLDDKGKSTYTVLDRLLLVPN